MGWGGLNISLSEPEYLATTSDSGTYSKQLERVKMEHLA